MKRAAQTAVEILAAILLLFLVAFAGNWALLSMLGMNISFNAILR